MSYYLLTKGQILERKTAFETVFDSDEKGNYYKNQTPFKSDLTLIIDYAGYLAYRALRIQQKYKNKEASTIKHMTSFSKADKAIWTLVHALGMDAIHTHPTASRMIQRFIATDSL